MNRVIVITGSTDGIGLATAKLLAGQGYNLGIHGRNQAKLENTKSVLLGINDKIQIATFKADLSDLKQTLSLADSIKAHYGHIDTLINNAGVYSVPQTKSVDGLDVRYVVNVITPYLLTRALLKVMNDSSRVVNLSSAAQAPFEPHELCSVSLMPDGVVYAKSKLALTMWTRYVSKEFENSGPSIFAVNPASMLGSKMVRDAYGVNGGDLNIGAKVLVEASLGKSFTGKTGQYFDNDTAQFREPHPFAKDSKSGEVLITILNNLVAPFLAIQH